MDTYEICWAPAGMPASTAMGYCGFPRIASWGFAKAHRTQWYTVGAPAGIRMGCREIPQASAGYHAGAHECLWVFPRAPAQKPKNVPYWEECATNPLEVITVIKLPYFELR